LLHHLFLLTFFNHFIKMLEKASQKKVVEKTRNRPSKRIKGSSEGHMSAHQFAMLRLVVFLSLLAFSLACKPSTSSASATTTTASTTPSSTTQGKQPTSNGKREVGQAHVLVVTSLKFNPAVNSILEKAFKQGVEQHAHKHGVHYDHNLVYGKTERIGHKFAMGYQILGADCEELENFISSGKRQTDLIGTVFAMCNGKLMVL
uniref:DrsE domain-containing protein n=1 Tax=Haemonchus contortus TaxID=6289 RepID=A0A7I4YGM0_HAECO